MLLEGLDNLTNEQLELVIENCNKAIIDWEEFTKANNIPPMDVVWVNKEMIKQCEEELKHRIK